MTEDQKIVVHYRKTKNGVVTWSLHGRFGYTLHTWLGYKTRYKTLYGALMAGNATDAPWSALAY